MDFLGRLPDEEKAAGDAKKMRKLVKERAPEGFVSWDRKTFERLQTASRIARCTAVSCRW